MSFKINGLEFNKKTTKKKNPKKTDGNSFLYFLAFIRDFIFSFHV